MPDSTSTSSSAPPATDAQRFRIRPRFRWFAYGLIAVGALYATSPWLLGTGAARGMAIGLGAMGVLLGGLYLLSPAWRMVIVVGDPGIELLTARGDRRFLVPWSEIARVVASPTTKTAFVDGGEPGRSLIVPGRGAAAPYAVDRPRELYDAILARVPADKVEEVELLSAAIKRAM
jgi:hypothetical protein